MNEPDRFSLEETDWLDNAFVNDLIAGYSSTDFVNLSTSNNSVYSLGIVSNEATVPYSSVYASSDLPSDITLADHPVAMYFRSPNDAPLGDTSLADASLDISLTDAFLTDATSADASLSDVSLANVPPFDALLADASLGNMSLTNILLEVSLGDVTPDNLSNMPLGDSPADAFPGVNIAPIDVAVTDIAPSDNVTHSPAPLKSKRRRCIRCCYNKRRCEPFGISICSECARSRLPPRVCIQVRFSDEPIFQKWANPAYQSRLRWAKLQWTANRQSLNVHHYATGPSILVHCREFVPLDNDQTTLWGKSKMGWKSVQTWAVGLGSCPSDRDIDEYVSKCVPHCVQEFHENELFKAILRDKTALSDLLSDTFRLWTATRLLVKIWEASEAALITDPDSPFFLMRPAPRVLQNELDLRLESYVSRLELRLLNRLQTAMMKRDSPWIEICSAVLVLLAVMEKDIWRLMYWIRHKEEAYKWRHPESAQRLIERAIFYVNLLLTHLQFAGDVPEHFRKIGSQMKAKNATLCYHEVIDNSLDGTLTRLAMIGSCHDVQLVKEADFCG